MCVLREYVYIPEYFQGLCLNVFCFTQNICIFPNIFRDCVSVFSTSLRTFAYSYNSQGIYYVYNYVVRINGSSVLPVKKYVTKLQALVYDIFPLTTAVFVYAIGPRKLSATEQFCLFCLFFVGDGAQTVVSLLQTTQIISDVSFLTDHVAYASSDKTKIVWIETEHSFLFFLLGVDASHVYVRAWTLSFFQSYQYQHSEHRFPAVVNQCLEFDQYPNLCYRNST